MIPKIELFDYFAQVCFVASEIDIFKDLYSMVVLLRVSLFDY